MDDSGETLAALADELFGEDLVGVEEKDLAGVFTWGWGWWRWAARVTWGRLRWRLRCGRGERRGGEDASKTIDEAACLVEERLDARVVEDGVDERVGRRVLLGFQSRDHLRAVARVRSTERRLAVARIPALTDAEPFISFVEDATAGRGHVEKDSGSVGRCLEAARGVLLAEVRTEERERDAECDELFARERDRLDAFSGFRKDDRGERCCHPRHARANSLHDLNPRLRGSRWGWTGLAATPARD